MANTHVNSFNSIVEKITKKIQQGEKPNLSCLNKANVNHQTKEGYTVLMTACLYLDVESVDEILKHEPKLTIEDSNGNNVLYWLSSILEQYQFDDVEKRRLLVFEKLVEYVKKQSDENLSKFKSLILNTIDGKSHNPLSMIIKNEFSEIVDLLIDEIPEIKSYIIGVVSNLNPEYLPKESDTPKKRRSKINRIKKIKNFLKFLQESKHFKDSYLDINCRNSLNFLDIAIVNGDFTLAAKICEKYSENKPLHLENALINLNSLEETHQTDEIRELLESTKRKITNSKRKQSSGEGTTEKPSKKIKTGDNYLLGISENTTLKDLIEKGLNRTNINTCFIDSSEGSFSALSKAAEFGSPQLIDDLVKMGADVKAVGKNKSNAMLIAAAKGKTDNVIKLIELGSDPKATNENGRNILHELFNLEDKIIGEEIDSYSDKVIELLDSMSPTELLKLLKRKDRDKKTPYDYAVKFGIEKVASDLFAKAMMYSLSAYKNALKFKKDNDDLRAKIKKLEGTVDELEKKLLEKQNSLNEAQNTLLTSNNTIEKLRIELLIQNNKAKDNKDLYVLTGKNLQAKDDQLKNSNQKIIKLNDEILRLRTDVIFLEGAVDELKNEKKNLEKAKDRKITDLKRLTRRGIARKSDIATPDAVKSSHYNDGTLELIQGNTAVFYLESTHGLTKEDLQEQEVLLRMFENVTNAKATRLEFDEEGHAVINLDSEEEKKAIDLTSSDDEGDKKPRAQRQS